MSNNNNVQKNSGSADQVNGDNNNDLLVGTSDGEKVDGKAGDDSVAGAGGDDWTKGGSGDDRLIYVVGLNEGSTDLYDGGSGSNILQLEMTREEWMRDDIQADIAGYLAFLSSPAANAKGKNASSGYEFTSLGLTARRLQNLEVVVDGVSLDPRDEPITANNVYETTLTEHSIVTGNVVANDDVPDLVREVTLVAGPDKGTLTLEADGRYTYDPGMDFDYLAEGESADVEFTYQVTDADRDSATAVVVITVTGTNDAPIAVAATGATDENAALTVDVLANDTDVDLSDTHTVTAVSIADGLGSVAIVDNQVQWTPGADYDYLAGDETATIEIDYTIADNRGAEASSVLTITVTGSNDAPTVAYALSATASEEDPVFTIDLLEGAVDVDNGAVLSVSDFSVAGGKGGWVLDGNQLTIDPDYYDDLNTGDLETLDFSYKVTDGVGGEVDQTLTLNIEGFTDAPSLAASATAGSKVNELKVKIASQPAKTESILLTFSNLPGGARVLNASGVDVTAGVSNFVGIQDFVVVVPPGEDADFDFGMTVTGLNPDGSEIASTSGAIDFVYDHNTLEDQVIFRSEKQSIWTSGDAPMIQWHEYVPIIGGKAKEWNDTDKVWENTGEGPWTSGEFSLLSTRVSAEDAIDIALAGPRAVLQTATNVYNAAVQAAQNVLNGAGDIYRTATAAANSAFDKASQAAWSVFNATVGTAAQAVIDAAYAAYNTAIDIAAGARDVALVADFLDVATGVIWDIYYAAESVARSALNVALDAAEGIESGARTVLNEAIEAARVIKDGAIKLANDALQAARDVFDLAKQGASATLNLAQQTFTGIETELNKVQGETRLDINADLYGQVGVQVNFVLDSGSVDTEVQYDVSSTLQHNLTSDTMLITPHLVNKTTGDAVAFETISPNASLKAVLIYDVGAKLNILLDSNLMIGSNVIWDITPGSGPISLSPQVSTGGWRDNLEDLNANGITVPAGSDGIDVASFTEGEFVLVDLNTKDLAPIKVPIESLTEDILSLTVGFPTIETQGTAAVYDPSDFAEGGLIAVDVSELTGTVMNLINARLDFSPELKALYPELGSLQDSDSFAGAIAKVGDALLSTLFDALDGQSKRTPILLLDANDQTSSEFLHLNAIPDAVIGDTLTADTAKIGFFTAYGESNDLVKVTIDIDQAVAVIVNKVVEAILAAVSGGATVKPLQTLDDINPLDLSFGLEEILKVVEVPPATITEIKKYFDLSVGFESADIDVYSAYNFSQEFTLSIDDVAYVATMEDETQYFFAANDNSGLLIENASKHDADGDGVVNYTISLAPEAMFSNDTEIGLTVGYVLDFLRASMKADVKLPLGDLLKIPALPTIPLNLANVNLGPLLRIQGDLDLASADIFESRFDFDLSSDTVDGSYQATDDQLVTLVGVMPV
ncbi:MAG: cadherin-like domain-containing protein [Gammaproteobacteria bacterium]|nr:cadherin-like domain-containing protein [Gammaproteobacteria bacterium]